MLWQGLRSIIFHLMLWLTTITLLPLLLLLGIGSSQPARNRLLAVFARSVLWLLRVIVGLDYTVQGRENIPADSAVILCKHQSMWETFALQEIFPAQTWVLKQELLRIPVFGWGLLRADAIAIDRSAGTRSLRAVIEQGTDRLQRGLFVVVFPEGTRIRPGERGKYNAGGAMLAARAGRPVVPVAHNAGTLWSGSGFMIRPGTVQLAIGPAIGGRDIKASELNSRAEEWIEEKMKELPGCRTAASQS